MTNATNKINIQVNGETQACEAATPLLELLTQLQLNPRLIAVEYNGEILHRQHWDKTRMQSGDSFGNRYHSGRRVNRSLLNCRVLISYWFVSKK